jgi:glyoxylase-like metal-dependent hydrolase (beta-lactamase superfamily II)
MHRPNIRWLQLDESDGRMSSGGWYEVVRFPAGVTMIAEPGHSEDVKSYLVEGSREVAVLDTGMGIGDFAGEVARLTQLEPIVLQSHAHFDHIGASARFERVLVHPSEADALRAGYSNAQFRPWFEPEHLRGIALPQGFDPGSAAIPGAEPTGKLNHGDSIDLGSRSLDVYHTPGHSPGGITLVDRAARIMFPGDAIYAGPMFAWRVYSDPQAYRSTLRLIAELADQVDTIYPSHNRVPLAPDDARRMHAAYEEIWAGRMPDLVLDDRHIFNFDEFSFWLRPGGYGEASDN